MATPDMLLHLIADLQRDMTVTHGRRTLLRYARSLTGAHLALLFVRDKEHQKLNLLEQAGRRSQYRAYTNREHFDPKSISQEGLFGAVLREQGPLHIAWASTDSRTLKEEEYWIGRDSHVILSAIGQQQGVLVLCFDAGDKAQSRLQAQTSVDEGNLLVCTTLLSAYLTTSDKEAIVKSGNEKAFSQLSPADFPASTSSILPVARRRASPELVRQQEYYEMKLKAAIEEERRRIAHDIHDGPAQHIAHVMHKLAFIQGVLERQPEVALREISRISGILKESLDDLRYGISSLLPVQLEEQGFDSALQSLLDEYTRDNPTLSIDYGRENFTRLPPSLEAPIFRFIQEALNNIDKHADASHVVVRMRVFAGQLLAEVSDNGRGFDIKEFRDTASTGSMQHMGLRVMRERIQQAGGKWDVQSKRGEGTSVKARFLLAPPMTVLTYREREVLRLLVEGLTNRAIAAKLSVSTETIKSHVHHIMQKMHVHDRTQAAVIATKQQWL